MEDPQPLPTTPTSGKFRSTSSATPKTPLRPSPTPYQPKYSHPYGIKSTSSGVLSSAAVSSSPNNASSAHGYQQHKSSKSMHSLLRNSSSVDDLAASAAVSPGSPISPAQQKQETRHGAKLTGFNYDSIGTRKRTLAQRASMSDLATIAQDSPGGRDLECLASPRKKVTELREEWTRAGNGQGEGDGLAKDKAFEAKRWIRELDKLPKNPKQWTTAELATFVGATLMLESSAVDIAGPSNTPGRDMPRTPLLTSTKANHVGHHVLPSAVIEEIKSWIYRQRLNGKAFVLGAKSDWAASEQAPPFLPILLSLSRHLRRASLNGTSFFRHSSLSLDSCEDPFLQDSATSAYDRHIKESSVLQETDENDDPQDIVSALMDEDEAISHVRQVAARFNRRSFDGLHSQYSGEYEHDVFSPLARPKLKSRTMSLSSSHSAASLLSSDAGDSVCVSERAALFESDVVGRHRKRSVEEREGRVLGRDLPSKDDLVSRLGPTKAAGEAADLDATIKASMLGPTIGDIRDNGRMKSPAPPCAETPPSQLSDADVLDTTDLPAIPARLAAVAGGYFDHHSVNARQSDPPASFCGRADISQEADGLRATLAPAQSDSAPGDLPEREEGPLRLKPIDEDMHPVSPYMSHMAAHEKAGLKPYGALRRAHSSPVPRFYEKRTLDSDNDVENAGTGAFDIHTLVGVVHHRAQAASAVWNPSESSSFYHPRSGEAHRAVTVQSFRPGRREAARLFSLQSPDAATEHGADTPETIAWQHLHDPLQQTEERLAAARARIGALEQALAEVVEEKAVLQKRLALVERESRMTRIQTDNPDKSGDPASEGHHAPSVTILWRWLTTGQTDSPVVSAFGPPQSLGQLPGYVLLVGVGLSVIVARVVLSRPMSRGK